MRNYKYIRNARMSVLSHFCNEVMATAQQTTPEFKLVLVGDGGVGKFD